MILESGLSLCVRDIGKKGLPDPYTCVINRLNLMKNRDSIYDNELIEAIAILIANNDSKISNEDQGIIRIKNGTYKYRRKINSVKASVITGKTFESVKEKRKKYIQKITGIN